MPSILSLSRISKALDSKSIPEVSLALQDLDDVEKIHEDAVEVIISEFITFDLLEFPDVSELIIRNLLGTLESQNSTKLEKICVNIVKSQSSVAVPIAVEYMKCRSWTLSNEECRSVWRKIESIESQKTTEYLQRTAANCTVLRISDTPRRFLSSMLLDALKLGCLQNPPEFLTELSINCPFHPLLEIEDFKNHPDVFLIPRVFSEEFRFHAEIEQFTKFMHPGGGFDRQRMAREMLSVFRKICDRMDIIEELGAADIDKVVKFWLAGIRIFDGSGIGMNDIQDAAKLIEKTAGRFKISRRPLFLKHFLRNLSEEKDSQIGLEPQLVATIITTFQRNAFGLRSSEFYEELGEFWTLCWKMKYDDVYYSTVYFSSVFALAQAQAVFKVKKEMLRNVYETILKPMHAQIVDFVKIKNVEKEQKSQEDAVVFEQNNLGFSYFSIVICTYKNAEERILAFLNE